MSAAARAYRTRRGIGLQSCKNGAEFISLSGAPLTMSLGLTEISGSEYVAHLNARRSGEKHRLATRKVIVAYELRILRRALLALLLLFVPRIAHADTTTLVCSNLSSGTTWDVKVDFDHHMVDSFPAEISDQSITWQDPQRQGIYEFDRASGNMTMRGPSSTGGYFLYYHCRVGH